MDAAAAQPFETLYRLVIVRWCAPIFSIVLKKWNDPPAVEDVAAAP